MERIELEVTMALADYYPVKKVLRIVQRERTRALREQAAETKKALAMIRRPDGEVRQPQEPEFRFHVSKAKGGTFDIVDRRGSVVEKGYRDAAAATVRLNALMRSIFPALTSQRSTGKSGGRG